MHAHGDENGHGRGCLHTVNRIATEDVNALKFLYCVLQVFWLRVGRRIFRRLYQSTLNPYDKFSDHDSDIFARAKRDLSYYSQSIHLSGNQILDVGSGSGRKTALYSTKHGGAVGVDIKKWAVKESHRFVRNRKLEQVDFIVAEAGHLPFRRDFFDIVISNDALEHIKNWRKTILEMKRVVKSGGHVCINFGPLWLSPFGSHMSFREFFSPPWAHLIFSEETIKDVLILFGKVKEIERNKHLFMHHLNRITASEFKEMLRNTKFNVLFIKLRTFPPFEPLLKTPFREFFTTQIITILEEAHT